VGARRVLAARYLRTGNDDGYHHVLLRGLELVGITAAEADNPEQSIPKATNQVIYRILIFYVGSLAVLLSLLPWTRVTADTSPFVLIFHELGDTFVANALNIVVLTAALSVYNSCVYCNSRMLFGLAQQGNAPKCCFPSTNVAFRLIPFWFPLW
jgi:L-asparagine transporter-like permease